MLSASEWDREPQGGALCTPSILGLGREEEPEGDELERKEPGTISRKRDGTGEMLPSSQVEN